MRFLRDGQGGRVVRTQRAGGRRVVATSMHPRAPTCTARPHGRTAGRTWQTLGVNVVSELLRTAGWNVRMRRLRWALRIRQYLTLATVMATGGTALGYLLATRDVTDEDRYADPDRAE